MPNITMTRENVAYMVDGFDGDFIGFNTYFEGAAVSFIPPTADCGPLLISLLSTRDLTLGLI